MGMGHEQSGLGRRVYHSDDGYDYEPCPKFAKGTWDQIAVRQRLYRDIDPETGNPVAGSEGEWWPLR